MASPRSPAEVVTELYRAGVDAAAPGPALTAALEAAEPPAGRVWIVALGKAARPMASAAVAHLAKKELTPAGGLVVAPQPAPPPEGLTALVGDHPYPGPGSVASAKSLGTLSAAAGEADETWVLLSGGATSLTAAPVDGIGRQDLETLYRALLDSGLDIARMNTVRKRFSRWGAGRLAVALHPSRVRTFAISDVIGDDPSAIGSGPCVPDEATAREVREILDAARLWDQLPPAIDEYLDRVERDASLETPKSTHPAFVKTEWRIVAGNRLSLEAVAGRARQMGLRAELLPEPVSGEAAQAGRLLAGELSDRPAGTCLIAGGETVVTIPAGSLGRGGRCQELALAAARELLHLPASATTLLAAGTDGRDGPNDAAGAIVDGSTWEKIKQRGRDPEADLASHNSYPALDCVGALLKTGLTGTNVMDLLIGLIPKV